MSLAPGSACKDGRTAADRIPRGACYQLEPAPPPLDEPPPNPDEPPPDEYDDDDDDEPVELVGRVSCEV